jgi:hypothetical protein
VRQGEFEEIGHSGGQVIFGVVTKDGRRMYQVTWQHSRPTPASIFAVYAIPQGAAVGSIQLGGIGQPWNPAPIPGCYPVFIASDSEGLFGHECLNCSGYWRSHGATMCPYCGTRAERHNFLTAAQQRYVQQYCRVLNEVLAAEQDGDHVINMDAVADAAGKDTEKPAFYYAEESQQKKFTCSACGGLNDILGKYGYCSACGTRNDLQELESDTIQRLRARINAGGPYEACVKDAVAAFDSFAGQYTKQLVQRVPLTPRRKARIERMRFHNLGSIATEMKTVFDIDILKDMKQEDVAFATLMFHRRHIYEHNGGEADEKYVSDSGDTTVRLKQAIHESQGSAHRLAGLVLKMATNLHRDFHDIFPPDPEPIDRHAKRQQAMTARQLGPSPRDTSSGGTARHAPRGASTSAR